MTTDQPTSVSAATTPVPQDIAVINTLLDAAAAIIDQIEYRSINDDIMLDALGAVTTSIRAVRAGRHPDGRPFKHTQEYRARQATEPVWDEFMAQWRPRCAADVD